MTTPDRSVVQQAERSAVQALLDATALLHGDDWQAPSALPGWSRAHLGSHLARNAEAIARVLRGVASGRLVFMYDSPESRDAAITQGAIRPGSVIQQDLVETVSQLQDACDQLSIDQWDAPLALQPTFTLPRAELVIQHRLNEVVVHHIDLLLDATFDDLAPTVAGWLLDRNLSRAADRYPTLSLCLVDELGTKHEIGPADRHVVTGSRQHLLGWLLGRLDPAVVAGAGDFDLPKF